MKAVDIMYDIADAIRERASLPKTTLIPPRGTNGFAQRINALVAGTGANPDARRLFQFSHFLTPAEEQERGLWRLDGRPLFASINSTMHALFKVGALWQSGEIAISPSRIYDTFLPVGTNELYVGSSTSLNHILVINTSNGAVTTIPMPASRPYDRFDFVSPNWIYCFQMGGSITGHSSIFVINTATKVVSTITLPGGNRFWSGGPVKFGNRWYLSPFSSSVTDLVYIDVTTPPGTAHSIPNVTSTSRGQRFIVASNSSSAWSKLVIAGTSNSDYLAVVDGATGNVEGEIPGLPNRMHDCSYSCGRWLYLVPGTSTSVTSIVRIDMNTLQFWGEITVPSRKYGFTLGKSAYAFLGKLIGDKIYVGYDTDVGTDTESLVVIQNSTGNVRELGAVDAAVRLPRRRYQIIDDDPASFRNWNTYWDPATVGQAWFQRTHLVGANLFLTSTSSSYADIVYIGTNASWPPTDSINQITGMASRGHARFFVNANTTPATLYVFGGTSANNIELISLGATPARLTPLTGLVSLNYAQTGQTSTPGSSAWMVTGTGASARLYLGSGTSSATGISIINLSNNTLDSSITNLTNTTYAQLILLNGKIYVGRTGTQTGQMVLGDSFLPNSPLPVYIRPD